MRRLQSVFAFFVIATYCSVLIGCGSDDVETDIDTEEKTETTINYTITISPDLLKFVTPQVSYVDENGNLVTITGVEELDGKVIENSTKVSNGELYASSWSSTVITGTGYKCWTIQIKYNHLGFHSYMSVKYLRNDFVEDPAGKKYDFYHDINSSASATKISELSIHQDQKNYVTVPTKDYHFGDNIDSYLNSLYNNPDKVGYYVDDNGSITRRDDS